MKMYLKMLIAVSLALMGASGRAGAFELPEEALKLMAQASVDPCSICAQADLKKAFKLLEKAYALGSTVSTGPGCRLVKAGPDANDLAPTCFPSEAFMGELKEGERPPKVVFTFYTPERKLVGIAENDLTPRDQAGVYEQAKPGAVFEGRLEVVRYPYGDGACFNYFRESGRLQVHCRVIELKPADE